MTLDEENTQNYEVTKQALRPYRNSARVGIWIWFWTILALIASGKGWWAAVLVLLGPFLITLFMSRVMRGVRPNSFTRMAFSSRLMLESVSRKRWLRVAMGAFGRILAVHSQKDDSKFFRAGHRRDYSGFLAPKLRSSNFYDQWRALEVIHAFSLPISHAEVSPYLESPDPFVRRSAARLLLPEPEYAASALDSEDDYVWLAATAALARNGQTVECPKLRLQRLRNQEMAKESLRQDRVLEDICSLPFESVAPLIVDLTKDAPHLHRGCIKNLLDQNCAAADAFVRGELASDIPSRVRAVLLPLSMSGREPPDTFARFQNHLDKEVRSAAKFARKVAEREFKPSP